MIKVVKHTIFSEQFYQAAELLIERREEEKTEMLTSIADSFHHVI